MRHCVEVEWMPIRSSPHSFLCFVANALEKEN